MAMVNLPLYFMRFPQEIKGKYYWKQEMLSSIYETIADKSLTFWCYVTLPSEEDALGIYINDCKVFWLDLERVKTETVSELNIIWHLVLLWHAIQYANMVVWDNSKNFDYTEEIEEVEKSLLQSWIYYTKPIEDQPMEAIELLYYLLPTK